MLLIVLIAAALLYLYEKAGKGSTAASVQNQSSSAFQNNLDNFGEAIKQFEGWSPGSTSYRNNNPGNIKAGSYTRDRIGTDQQNFAVFADVGDGWDALNNYIQAHAADNPTWNFYDFFNYYLHGSTSANPVDSQGNSTAYANYVANYMGVDPNTPVSSLFGYS